MIQNMAITQKHQSNFLSQKELQNEHAAERTFGEGKIKSQKRELDIFETILGEINSKEENMQNIVQSCRAQLEVLLKIAKIQPYPIQAYLAYVYGFQNIFTFFF